MKWIIDRIENNIAVCELENGEMLDVKISALPKGIKEGDVIKLSVDETETNERKERIDKLMNSLFKDE
ncbi:MAG TPA: DUF3006 domain-containing protein [Ruminococcaceae bacterium]|nr:DUF3006 domain-containing protein [Oscillospiraceae bacterium]